MAAALQSRPPSHVMPCAPLDELWEPADPAAAGAAQSTSEVHLWLLPLDHSTRPHADLATSLSPDERARAARFHFDLDRRRFEAARGLLRWMLGLYLGVAPADLRFAYGQHGKPSIANVGRGRVLEFNLSHSGTWALLGVTRGLPIGVDVEVLRDVADCSGIVRANFAPSEAAELFALPRALQPAAFFAGWTRKEAYVKAVGGGLAVPLDGFEVSLDPRLPARLRTLAGSEEAARAWTLWGFEPLAGAWCAVAARGRALALRRFRLV